MEEITVRALQYICNIGFSAVTKLFKDNELFKRGQVRVNKTQVNIQIVAFVMHATDKKRRPNSVS